MSKANPDTSGVIKKSTYNFLKRLAANNNRDWFSDHKLEYQEALRNAEEVMDALLYSMSKHDSIETPSGKKALYRIYNDVRFAKDKTPYTARFSGYLRRAKPQLRGGYYIRIKPGASRIACGFSHPDADDLKRIRLDISSNHSTWKKLLRSKSLISNYGEMKGEKVKTAPRGFERNDPALDLLRHKQFWFEHSFTDKEVLSADFVVEVNRIFKSVRPFFDYMSELLTTDVNGESVI